MRCGRRGGKSNTETEHGMRLPRRPHGIFIIRLGGLWRAVERGSNLAGDWGLANRRLTGGPWKRERNKRQAREMEAVPCYQ